MASVYILYSPGLDIYYTGSCKDLSYRINQHVNKVFTKSFTSVREDWELFFYEDNLGYKQARSIEAHIKRMKSKTYIHNIKEYPEIIEKLREKYKE